MDNLPNCIVIKHVLVGQGLVGRPARLEIHRGRGYSGDDLPIYRTFDRVPALAKWLSDNGYRYVPDTHAEWTRI